MTVTMMRLFYHYLMPPTRWLPLLATMAHRVAAYSILRSVQQRGGRLAMSAVVPDSPPPLPPRDYNLSPWTAIGGVLRCRSFHEFMLHLRSYHGNVIRVNLQPVLPPLFVLMGKEANRGVFSELDASMEQVLQQLINVLPVSAKIPSDVDAELQRRVASLFQSERTIDDLLPSFRARAERIRSQWLTRGGVPPLKPFFELSEFVLLADLELLYGASFVERYGERILPRFELWVENIANGQLVGFFDELGTYLKEALEERVAAPQAYAHERCVLQIYLESGALERHDVNGVVGLLSMTLMAAVFNTQVWTA